MQHVVAAAQKSNHCPAFLGMAHAQTFRVLRSDQRPLKEHIFCTTELTFPLKWRPIIPCELQLMLRAIVSLRTPCAMRNGGLNSCWSNNVCLTSWTAGLRHSYVSELSERALRISVSPATQSSLTSSRCVTHNGIHGKGENTCAGSAAETASAGVRCTGFPGATDFLGA